MANIKDLKPTLGPKTGKLVRASTGDLAKLADGPKVALDKASRVSNSRAVIRNVAGADVPAVVPPPEPQVAAPVALAAGPVLVKGAPKTLVLAKPISAQLLAEPAFRGPFGDRLSTVLGKQPRLIRSLLPVLLTPVFASFVAGFQEAYAKLTPEQKAQYDAVAKAMAHDPEGRRALAIALVDGKLFERDLADGKTLLDHLQAIATGPVAPGIDRERLLGDVVKDIANPLRIDQGNYHTCAAATGQALLASQTPAEYARLMAGLASPAGEVKLANGDTLKRAWDWNKAKPQGDTRSQSGSLFQASLTAYAAAKTGQTYYNSSDSRTTPQGARTGLTAEQVLLMFEGILGKNYDRFAASDIGPDELFKRIASAVAQGVHVPCAVTIDGAHHEVLVESITDGQVTYYDPRDGNRYTVSEAQFKEMLFNANLPAPAILIARALALKNIARFGAAQGGTGMLSASGGTGGLKPATTGTSGEGGGAPASAGGSRGPKAAFGLGSLDTRALLAILFLVGATDEEIGDGGSTGSGSTGGTSGSSSSTTTSSTSKGRGSRRGASTQGG